MFLVPSHIYDTSFYCKDAEESLVPYPAEEDIIARKKEIEDGLLLSTEDHQALCVNLNCNSELLPRSVKELLEIYEEEKKEKQRRINKELKKQRLKAKKAANTPREQEETEKLQELQQRILEGTRQFLCQWRPLLQSRDDGRVVLQAWANGLSEYSRAVSEEIEMWKDLKKPQREQLLLLSVTYRDGGTQQVQDFQVSNKTQVSEFARLVQKRLGISLKPNEELRFFCIRGALKNSAFLNQYEADKIAHLKLFKIQQDLPASSVEEV